MKKWSVDLFANFLYTEYPGRPPKQGQSSNDNSEPLTDYRTPDFPANPTPTFIDLNIIPPNFSDTTTHSKGSLSRGNPDYEKEARKLKTLGDRGEKIVMDLERKRLTDVGRKDLVKKIERVSLKSDSLGYDILSFEKDGAKRFIEVKATRSKIGSAIFSLYSKRITDSTEIRQLFYLYGL